MTDNNFQNVSTLIKARPIAGEVSIPIYPGTERKLNLIVDFLNASNVEEGVYLMEDVLQAAVDAFAKNFPNLASFEPKNRRGRKAEAAIPKKPKKAKKGKDESE